MSNEKKQSKKQEKMRLDKFVSHCTGLTRSEARNDIKRGKVFVNSQKVKKADFSVFTSDEITYCSKKLVYNKYIYIMLNKPKDVLCATEDKNGVTVIDLIKEDFTQKNMFPAGRLDKDSTGFVLITNDGDYAHAILSPKSHVEKTYTVILDTKVTQEMVCEFEKGVVLHDGTKTLPSKLILHDDDEFKATVILTQGIYHQIKRMFGALGAGVNELNRDAIGGLNLDENLKIGEYRQISEEELAQLNSRA